MKSPHIIALSIALLLFATNSSIAQTMKTEQSPIQKEITAHRNNIEEFKKKLLTFKNAKEQKTYYKKNYPNPRLHVDKVIELVTENPTTRHAEVGLLWILKIGNRLQVDKAKSVIYEHYKNHKVMGMYCYWLFQKGPQNIEELNNISTLSTNQDVIESCNYYQAVLLEKIAKTEEDKLKQIQIQSKADDLFTLLFSSEDLEKRNKTMFDLLKKKVGKKKSK